VGQGSQRGREENARRSVTWADEAGPLRCNAEENAAVLGCGLIELWPKREKERGAAREEGKAGRPGCWAEQEEETGLQAEKGRERERNENTFPNFFSIFPFSFSNQFQLEF